ncbi:muconolactone Delta-isomerase family protein [Streptomyces sp. NPDC039016]
MGAFEQRTPVAGDLDAVRRQLADGAEVDARFPVVNGFNDAHTPLLVACRDGHEEIARELIAAGADLNATEPTFGAVPLHKAVYNGHTGITSLLVKEPGIDLDFQGITNGYTPLHDALWHGHEECARVLIDAGARPDLTGHDGRTPADIARESLGAAHLLTRALTDALAAPAPARITRPLSRTYGVTVLFYVQMKWNHEGRISLDQLWEVEAEETVHAKETIDSGMVVGIWKVAAQKRVIAVVDCENAEELDRTALGRLPMREYLEFEVVWPLRDYLGFGTTSTPATRSDCSSSSFPARRVT